jgi:hypothetical protein
LSYWGSTLWIVGECRQHWSTYCREQT